MSKVKIIAIAGLDGSGKTTQLNLLSRYLKERGIKVHKTYIANRHAIAWIICRLIVKLGLYVWRPSEEQPLEKQPRLEVFRGKISRKLWLIIETFSIFLAVFLKVYLPKKLGYLVLVEEYILGSIANLVNEFGDFSIIRSRLVRMLLTLANRQDTLYVYLQIDYETHKKRRPWKIERLEYIKIRKGVMEFIISKNILRNCDILIIDASRNDAFTIHKLIKDYLMRRQLI